jgi:hypothetical protein
VENIRAKIVQAKAVGPSGPFRMIQRSGTHGAAAGRLVYGVQRPWTEGVWVKTRLPWCATFAPPHLCGGLVTSVLKNANEE